MHDIYIRRIVVHAVIAVTLTAVPLTAQQSGSTSTQPTGIQAALVTDEGNLSDKFAGLARVMAGKYDWRPGQGVRSVGEVFNLIVLENKLLAGVLSGTPAQGGQAAPITDPAALQEALRSSYAGVSKAISALSAGDMQTPVKIFGHDTTKQGAALMVLLDQHEHLGQSIAYARSNGIVPPWSK